jgi:serine/threonine-protein kinase PknG
MFGPEVRVPSTTGLAPSLEAIVKALPVPLIDRDDPGAQFLAGLGAVDLAEQGPALAATTMASISPEVQLRQVLVQTALKDLNGATRLLDIFENQYGGDWRTFWYRGLIALAYGSLSEARKMFTAVYDALPGEAAPKLAIAACAELSGDFQAAGHYYATVWQTDHGYVSAAFGLARVDLAIGHRAEAVAAFGSVPETSTHHTAAREAALHALLADRKNDLTGPDLADVDARFAWLADRLDPEHTHRLALEVLDAALLQVVDGPVANLAPGQRLVGRAVTERDLRFGLETAYRALARLASDRNRRIELVDLANDVRPRTLV